MQGERFINRSVVSSLSMYANRVTMEAFRELKLLRWILLMIRAPLQTLFCGDCEKTNSRTRYNTFDTLKASMVADFADIEAFKESKV